MAKNEGKGGGKVQEAKVRLAKPKGARNANAAGRSARGGSNAKG